TAQTHARQSGCRNPQRSHREGQGCGLLTCAGHVSRKLEPDSGRLIQQQRERSDRRDYHRAQSPCPGRDAQGRREERGKEGGEEAIGKTSNLKLQASEKPRESFSGAWS